MQLVHCHHCNAKALAGATRCPRCQASFLETPPARASEVPRRRSCPTCGDVHMGQHDACVACRKRERAGAQRRAANGLRIGAGIAAAVVMAMLAVRGVASRVSHPPASVANDAQAPAAQFVSAGPTAVAAQAVPQAAAVAPSTSAPLPSIGAPNPAATIAPAPASRLIALAGDPPRSATIDDAISWVEAFAPRSMYLRAAPDRSATIARVIAAEELVLLGPVVAGWRMARAGGIDGYVAASFFNH
jgi:hypothetical protein